MDEPNDIQATGRCCCAGCIGMGPCDLDPPRALGGYPDGDDQYDDPADEDWPIIPAVTTAPSETYL